MNSASILETTYFRRAERKPGEHKNLRPASRSPTSRERGHNVRSVKGLVRSHTDTAMHYPPKPRECLACVRDPGCFRHHCSMCFVIQRPVTLRSTQMQPLFAVFFEVRLSARGRDAEHELPPHVTDLLGFCEPIHTSTCLLHFRH